jgi:dTDP-4-dehydrorhamnose reductase
MAKILVTGANGQLGKEIREAAINFPLHEFLFLSREDLPIHHFDLVRNTFDAFKPDYCINCAAYTAVDRAESEPELAYLINAEAVGILAAVAHERKCRFIHVSTDYVFPGNASVPYVESDETGPVSVYGKSKWQGEQQAMQQDPECVIIRTSWVYSRFGNNFVKTMLRLMKERSEISVVADQRGCPTWASDLADFILDIISRKDWHPGIYHYSNEGETTWFDFAVEIAGLIHSPCKVNPIPTSSYPTPAQRPGYSVMSKEKIKHVFGHQPPGWKSALGKCILQLQSLTH